LPQINSVDRMAAAMQKTLIAASGRTHGPR
jgi:hypothetical protein